MNTGEAMHLKGSREGDKVGFEGSKEKEETM